MLRRSFNFLQQRNNNIKTASTTTSSSKNFGDLLRNANNNTPTMNASTNATTTNNNRPFVRDIRSVRNRVKLDEFLNRRDEVVSQLSKYCTLNNNNNQQKQKQKQQSFVLPQLRASYDTYSSSNNNIVAKANELLHNFSDRSGNIVPDELLFLAFRANVESGDLLTSCELFDRIVRENRGPLVVHQNSNNNNNSATSTITTTDVLIALTLLLESVNQELTSNAKTLTFRPLPADLMKYFVSKGAKSENKNFSMMEANSVSPFHMIRQQNAKNEQEKDFTVFTNNSKNNNNTNRHQIHLTDICNNNNSVQSSSSIGGALYTSLRPHVQKLVENIFDFVFPSSETSSEDFASPVLADLFTTAVTVSTTLDLFLFSENSSASSLHVMNVVKIGEKILSSSTTNTNTLDKETRTSVANAILLILSQMNFVQLFLLQPSLITSNEFTTLLDKYLSSTSEADDLTKQNVKDEMKSLAEFKEQKEMNKSDEILLTLVPILFATTDANLLKNSVKTKFEDLHLSKFAETLSELQEEVQYLFLETFSEYFKIFSENIGLAKQRINNDDDTSSSSNKQQHNELLNLQLQLFATEIYQNIAVQLLFSSSSNNKRNLTPLLVNGLANLLSLIEPFVFVSGTTNSDIQTLRESVKRLEDEVAAVSTTQEDQQQATENGDNIGEQNENEVGKNATTENNKNAELKSSFDDDFSSDDDDFGDNTVSPPQLKATTPQSTSAKDDFDDEFDQLLKSKDEVGKSSSSTKGGNKTAKTKPQVEVNLSQIAHLSLKSLVIESRKQQLSSSSSSSASSLLSELFVSSSSSQKTKPLVVSASVLDSTVFSSVFHTARETGNTELCRVLSEQRNDLYDPVKLL